jgi:hypothetical protein
MKERVRRVRQTKSVELVLHTTDMMQAARHMYERMGLVRAPEVDFRPADLRADCATRRQHQRDATLSEDEGVMTWGPSSKGFCCDRG